jgi:hypothetical protein
MTKSELISRIAEQNPRLFAKDVEKAVNAVFDEVVAALVRSDRVELRGFGTFTVRTWGLDLLGEILKLGPLSVYLRPVIPHSGRPKGCAIGLTAPWEAHRAQHFTSHSDGLLLSRTSAWPHEHSAETDRLLSWRAFCLG